MKFIGTASMIIKKIKNESRLYLMFIGVGRSVPIKYKRTE